MLETVTARLERAVTPQLLEDFRRDGAVCIRQVFTQEEVALLRAGIDRNLQAPSPRAKVASRPDDPGWFFEDFCNWQDNEAYREFIFHSAAPAICRGAVGERDYTALPRSFASEGAEYPATHALASGPALLQHHRSRQRQHVDSCRSCFSGVEAGVCCGLASWPVVDAAYVHGQSGEVVS